jgi:hypothetical protein
MNADMYTSLKRSWAITRTRRAVDKKGLAVALTFLVALFVGARECSHKTADQASSIFQEQPEVSADIEIRAAGQGPRGAQVPGPGQSMTGVKRELDDPRGR